MIGNLLSGRVFRLLCVFLLPPVWVSASTEVRIATFNIEWLGHPQRSGEWFGSRDSQLRAAAGEILALDADVIALQEVVVDEVNGDALGDLVDLLRADDPDSAWEGIVNSKFSYWWRPDFESYPAQRQAFIWRGAKVAYRSSEVVLEWMAAWDDRFGSGRLPFLLEVDVGEGGMRFPLKLINLHLKCCRGSAERRSRSMKTLLNELHSAYADDSLVVLGDFNVADSGGSVGEIAEWGFYEDADGNGAPDFLHAAGAVNDLSWDDIDHIMLSSELSGAYARTPAPLRNVVRRSRVSDHGPVLTQLAFPASPGELYAEWVEMEFAPYPEFSGQTGYRDDPDGDRLTNFAEFVLGGNPGRKDSGTVGLKVAFSGSGDLLLSHRIRSALPPEGVSLYTRTSMDPPQAWTVPASSNSTTVLEPPSDSGVQRVIHTIPAEELLPSQFFHLRMVLPDALESGR